MSTAVTKLQATAAALRERSRVSIPRLAAIGDQIVVSLTNFGLTVAIGRAFSAEEFASYGIGLSIGLMVQALQRHTVTIPLMLQPTERVARRHRAVLAQQFILLLAVLAVGSAAIATAHLVGIPRYGLLIAAASAVCLIVYVELEFSRAFLIKTGQPRFLLASAGWYAFVSLLLTGSALTHRIDYEALLLVLGGAMILHALSLTAIAGWPAWRRGWRLLRLDIRRYGGWSAAATLTYTGYNHVPLLLLGALAAPIHAAAFVATRSLLQPLQIILRGLDIADKSMFSDVAKKPYARETLTVTLTLAGLYALIGAAFCILAGLFADTLLALAYGPKFAGFGPALLAWIPVYVLLSVAMPLESLVYARRDFLRYFQLRGVASLVAIALSFPLMTAYVETGAILACAAGWLIAVTGTLVRIIRTTGQAVRP
jgi:O-antigen/teichoic acid export membrane protein